MDAGAVRTTPQGGLEVEAVLSKPGVFTYYTETGKPVREYRPPEEVFRSDALATLANIPVTNRHHGVITAENWRQFAAGHVAGAARREGDTIVATLWIQDAQTLADIKAGRREVSLGTLWDIDPTPGRTPEGEPYDCIQRNPRYNHVAIEPKARLGSDMRLRLDGAGNQTPYPIPQDRPPMKLRLDGKDYDLSTPDGLAAYQAALSAKEARFDALQAEHAQAQSALSAAQARFDAETTPAALDARVQKRAALVSTAKHFLPELRCDGLSESEIQRKVVAKAYPSLRLDGKDDVYVRTLFEGAQAQATQAQAREDAAAVRGAEAPPAPDAEVREDGAEVVDVEAARKRMEARHKDAWKKPLARARG